jgi:hypothetical protein
MSEIRWPDGIPFCPVGDSYNEEPGDEVLRTPMETGPAKLRLRTTAAPDLVTFTLPRMSVAQYAQFKAWYSSSLKRGSLAFTAKHPIEAVDRSFRFTQSYTMNKAGRSCVVSLSLEVLP